MGAHVVPVRTFWAVEAIGAAQIHLAQVAFRRAVAIWICHVFHFVVVFAIEFYISAPSFRNRRRLFMVGRLRVLHIRIQVISGQIVQGCAKSAVDALEFGEHTIELESGQDLVVLAQVDDGAFLMVFEPKPMAYSVLEASVTEQPVFVDPAHDSVLDA